MIELKPGGLYVTICGAILRCDSSEGMWSSILNVGFRDGCVSPRPSIRIGGRYTYFSGKWHGESAFEMTIVEEILP